MGLALHEEYPWVDYVCRGEGERFIVQLLNHLETGRPRAPMTRVARVGPSSVPIGESTERVKGSSTRSPPRTTRTGSARHGNTALNSPPANSGCRSRPAGAAGGDRRATAPSAGSTGKTWPSARRARTGSGTRSTPSSASGSKLYFVDLILPLSYFKTLLPPLEANLGLTAFYEVKSNLTRNNWSCWRRLASACSSRGLRASAPRSSA